MPAKVLLLNIMGVNTVVPVPEAFDVSPEDIVELYDDVNVAASCRVIAECGPGEILDGAAFSSTFLPEALTERGSLKLHQHTQHTQHTHHTHHTQRREFDAFFELPSTSDSGPDPAPWEEFAESDGTFVYDCPADVASTRAEEDESSEDSMQPGLLVVHHEISRTTAVRRLPAIPAPLVQCMPGLTTVVHAAAKDTGTLDYLHQKFHRTFWGEMDVRDLASWARGVLDAPTSRTDPIDRHVSDFLNRNCRFDDPECTVSVVDLEAQLLDTFYAAMDRARPVMAMHSALKRRGVTLAGGMFRGAELVSTRKKHVDVAGCFHAEVSARASDFYGL